MKASDLMVKALENEGIEYVFGVPGEENLDFLESLRDSKIKLILTHHEQGATHMAAGYARATGRPGVVLVTSGPGATNTVTGLLTAHMDSAPMIVLCGQTIRESLPAAWLALWDEEARKLVPFSAIRDRARA